MSVAVCGRDRLGFLRACLNDDSQGKILWLPVQFDA